MSHDRVYWSAVAPVRVFHILVLAPYLPSNGFRWADLIPVLKDRQLVFIVDSGRV